MGVTSYYLGLPRQVLDRIESDPGSRSVMRALWHAGQGAWTATSYLDRDELLEYVEVLPDGIDAEGALDAFATLVRAANSSHPEITRQRAYVEKTHDFHQAIFRRWFSENGLPDAPEMARIALGGGSPLSEHCELWCTPEQQVKRLGEALRGAHPDELSATLPGLAEDVAMELWWFRDLSRDDQVEHLTQLVSDERFRHEVGELTALYERAATAGHLVLVG